MKLHDQIDFQSCISISQIFSHQVALNFEIEEIMTFDSKKSYISQSNRLRLITDHHQIDWASYNCLKIAFQNISACINLFAKSLDIRSSRSSISWVARQFVEQQILDACDFGFYNSQPKNYTRPPNTLIELLILTQRPPIKCIHI